MKMPVGGHMIYKIVVCGANGAGKSTLGQYLAKQLKAKFVDIEDYYFSNPEADYPYACARTTEEVRDLLLADMNCTLMPVSTVSSLIIAVILVREYTLEKRAW